MNVIGKIAQTAAALWILNVWTLRFNKDTGYRGGEAKNMKEEFAVYGLPEPAMYAVGATKVALASAMLVGGFTARPTFFPSERIFHNSGVTWAPSSTWTVTRSAPAFTNGSSRISGLLHIRWTSSTREK